MAEPETIAEARRDLAAAFRWAVRLGFNEGICNHFSCLVPGDGDHFLVNAYGYHWSEITAANLVVVDGDGRVVEGSGEVEATALYLHSRLHRAHPRARCVLHTHMPYATALTSLADKRLRMANQNAIRFWDRIAYDEDYSGVALDESEGDRVAAALGDKDILFMGNHGVMVVGPTVAEAFDELYYLERACQTQVLALSSGGTLDEIPSQLVEATAAQMHAKLHTAIPHFVALRRVLDRDEPDYAD